MVAQVDSAKKGIEMVSIAGKFIKENIISGNATAFGR